MKKYIYFSLILFLLFFAIYIYKLTTYTYVVAKFPELRPMKENIPVYYKGIIIGRARERKHSDSMEHTLIKIVLYPKRLLLPNNSEVYLKKEVKNKKDRDFLEIIYPKTPSKVMISNDTVLEGKTTTDVETFMKNQNPDDLEQIKENLLKSSENLNYALESLGQMFSIINEILEENRKNIFKTTQGFDSITSKINSSIDEKQLNNTLLSIENSAQNIVDLTGNINDTMPSTFEEINGTMKNLNVITCSIRKTLRKKAGAMRLLFGTVNDECDEDK